MSTSLFKYDLVLDEEDICNYDDEAKEILSYVDRGKYVKIFGRRNFGKTSLVKNVVAKRWQHEDADARVVVYCDFYPVQSLSDIDFELTRAFSDGLSARKSIFDKSLGFFKSLKNMQLTWEPPADAQSLGKFSISPTGKGTPRTSFNDVISVIDTLQSEGKFDFLLIMDEFQEIAEIPKAQAVMRGVLQQVKSEFPIIIMGSKQHLLTKIFYQPRAPFYQWGGVVELANIDYAKYHEYLAARFKKAGKKIDLGESIYLQDICDRIPEAINRFADFLCYDDEKRIVTTYLDAKMNEFVQKSRSIYAERMAGLKPSASTLVRFIASKQEISKLSSVDMQKSTGIAPTTAKRVMVGLIDHGLVYKNSAGNYALDDPFFCRYVKMFHPLD